ncbi:MAG: hypothetical protein Q9195_003769 [Heterodermia aff. obscurata]
MSRYVDFSLNRVRMLIHFGVTPYMVFDGDYLPSKGATEIERAKRRDESRTAGLQLLRVGKPTQAHKELQKAVDVTPEMAGHFIRELKKLGVQYVVAPYEADAQLAYLEKKGIIQGVLSEDSDLLVFGVKCLLTKLDQYGDCVEINRKDFTACRDISLVGWSDADFRLMAILSGCDYLQNITNMGLLTAYRLVRKHKTIDRILRMLQFDGKFYVPPGYLEAFQNAVLTFRHQRVFCPLSKRMAMVMEPDDTERDMATLDFIGAAMEPDVVVKVACGDLHPMTKKPLVIPSPAAGAPRTPSTEVSKLNGVKFTDLKENKSIESFFKAKRTPLAELDPNSFTPSPSQERLQQRPGGTWMSSPAPRRLTLPAMSQAEQILGTPSVTGAKSLSQRQPSQSAPQQPSKRRRLCSDPATELGSPLTGGEVSQSRFFAKKPAQPSSNMQITKKTKVKNADINIWSDDCIEDVMAELPDLSDCPGKGTEKMPIFEDEVKEGAQEAKTDKESSEKAPRFLRTDSAVERDSQGSVTSNATHLSEISMSTSATSVDVSAQTPLPSANNRVTAELDALKENFSYKAESASGAPRRSAASLKVKPGEYQARRASMKPPLTRTGSLTPLQRLGASALNRSQSFSGPVKDIKSKAQIDVPKLYPATGEIPKSIVTGENEPAGRRDSGADCGAVEKDIALPRNKGSEDLIIPDSEEDMSSSGSASEVEAAEPPKLNLGRFAFGN